jgi:hypothetical protein
LNAARLREQTPFVLAERTGGAFSVTVAVLKYRYLAFPVRFNPIDATSAPLDQNVSPVPGIEPFLRRSHLSKKVLR